ncbi:MAG: xanthine dehydrogenase small subunit [Rubrivivax sp.]|nr:xanthine dehydrogenase small subunit [Rubrivivax sp.]
MNHRPIRFFHRGALRDVSPATPTRTVLEWLREDARCTGTKEGCAEGDCGACMVVIGALDAQGALQLQAVNACIRFLPTLDGKALFTVEDVAAADGSLHPVQQSLVDCHGSQCGFCTPGFVMSLWACYQRHQAAGTVATRQQLADDLSGNLCRCTGYRPILDAAQQMFLAPAAPLATGPVLQALRALQAEPPLALPGFDAPRTVEAFATLLQAQPQARILAGSTDIGLWVNKQLRTLGPLVSINEVAALRTVEVTPTHIQIGAAASLESAWLALVAEHASLRDVWLRFASLPVRHMGTMGGNVANGSPIGDSAPVLMALDATLVLRRGAQQRTLALEDFYVGYMKNRLEPGEFIERIDVPRAAVAGSPASHLRVYKISKRFDSDISAVCAALVIGLERTPQSLPESTAKSPVHGTAQGSAHGMAHGMAQSMAQSMRKGARIDHVRLAFGGLAATVKRADAAEAALLGQPWSEAALQAAQQALAEDFQPLSDLRASAAYRLQVAQNLLRRFWLETRPVDALPESAVSVWAREAG